MIEPGLRHSADATVIAIDVRGHIPATRHAEVMIAHGLVDLAEQRRRWWLTAGNRTVYECVVAPKGPKVVPSF